MRITWIAALLLVLCFAPMLTLAVKPASASTEIVPVKVNVDHVVEVRDGGMLTVNDTVRLSSSGEAKSLTSYLLGFPYDYRTRLDYVYAHETKNPSSRLELGLNVGLGRPGLYGVNVTFPQPIDISNGKLYEFTVVFVFSNSITSRVFPIEETEQVMYNATFPAYPGLPDNAAETNVTVILPSGLDYLSSSYQRQGANLTRTVSGSKQYFSFVKGNLSEFSVAGGWFAIVKSAATLELLDVDEVKRTVEFSGLEQIVVVDTYTMVSKSDNLGSIGIKLPKGAFAITASTEVADISSGNINSTQTSAYTTLSILFPTSFVQGDKARFAVNYQLPWKDYVSTENWRKFKTSLTLLEDPDWTIKSLTVTLNLPEGASLVSTPSSKSLSSVQNGAFTSSLIFSLQNATRFNDLSVGLEYERAIFWESFRPTLWMGSFVTIVATIAVAWSSRRPAVAPLPTGIVPIRVEDLKSFIDSYDERRGLQREIESLEAQAGKGKIPRRRYRVRRMTIDGRLSALSRDLAVLRTKISTAGPRYADLMRQLEVTEAEQQAVMADINRTEIRYRRGEISAAAYHKLLEDYYRRRDRAKTTIDGVLLRLREEIS